MISNSFGHQLWLAALAIVAILPGVSQSAVTLRLDDGVVASGASQATINLFISGNAGEQPITIVADYSGPASLTGDGVFGQPGFFGAGDLNNTSSFNQGVENPSEAFLSLDFENPVTVPTAEAVLAQVTIDTSSLLLGSYELELQNVLGLTFNDELINFNVVQGTLTVVAVPEPSLALVVGVGAMAVVIRRRRRGFSRF